MKPLRARYSSPWRRGAAAGSPPLSAEAQSAPCEPHEHSRRHSDSRPKCSLNWLPPQGLVTAFYTRERVLQWRQRQKISPTARKPDDNCRDASHADELLCRRTCHRRLKWQLRPQHSGFQQSVARKGLLSGTNLNPICLWCTGALGGSRSYLCSTSTKHSRRSLR